MKKRKQVIVPVVILTALLLAGCGKAKENFIDGVAYFNASNTDYSSVVRSDPECVNPVIAEEYEGRKVEAIYQEAFSEAALTSIVIPECIVHLSPHAFADCHHLKEITIEGSPRLCEGCFCRLDALEIVTFGPGTESIPMEAFEDCGALREIYVRAACAEITGVVPDGVTLILQSVELVGAAIENGWNYRMEDGSEAAAVSLAEAVKNGWIEWNKAAENPDGAIDIVNVSDQILIVDWPDYFELEAGEVTYYLPEGGTASLKPGDSLRIEAEYYTAYGPEETTVQIAAESEYLYCRLYKQNNILDAEFLVEPHARENMTIPCGRYVVRILPGETAEEADPETAEDSDWHSDYVFDFEGGSFYEVHLNRTGSFKSEKYGEYGPGESSLYLKAGERSACYRLVRVGGGLEQEVFLEPGEYRTISFPSGRYKLRAAEGDTWISDEEAFGKEGRYSVFDYFDYEEGETYGITETTDHGNSYKDSAGGFRS